MSKKGNQQTRWGVGGHGGRGAGPPESQEKKIWKHPNQSGRRGWLLLSLDHFEVTIPIYKNLKENNIGESTLANVKRNKIDVKIWTRRRKTPSHGAAEGRTAVLGRPLLWLSFQGCSCSPKPWRQNDPPGHRAAAPFVRGSSVFRCCLYI